MPQLICTKRKMSVAIIENTITNSTITWPSSFRSVRFFMSILGLAGAERLPFVRPGNLDMQARRALVPALRARIAVLVVVGDVLHERLGDLLVEEVALLEQAHHEEDRAHDHEEHEHVLE